MNPMTTIKVREKYCDKQIKRNIKELGCLVISLLGDCDEVKVYADDSYRINW